MKASRIVVVLLMLVLLGATGFFGYQYFTSTARATASHKEEAKGEVAKGEEAKGEEAKGEVAKGEVAEAEATPDGPSSAVLYPLKSFVVNLADKPKGRYLKVTLALVTKKSIESRFEKDALALASVQDRIITVLTSKTVDDLLTADGKFLLKQELTLQINSILGDGSVQDIYFADFIIQ
jgi:flagellar protein FliL